jgi:hypothetical protein
MLTRQMFYHMSSVLFALVIFGIGSYIYAPGSMDHNPPIYTSHIAGMTGMRPAIGWDGHLANFFDWIVLELQSPPPK